MKKVFALIGTVLPVLCVSLLTNQKPLKAEATDTPIQYIGDLYQIEMVSTRTKVVVNDLSLQQIVTEAGRTLEREIVPGSAGGIGGDLPPIIERPGIRRSHYIPGPVFQDYQYYYYATPTEPKIVGKVQMYNTPGSLKTAVKYLENIADFYEYGTKRKNNSVLSYIRTINKSYADFEFNKIAGDIDKEFRQAVNSLTSIGSMTIRDYFASFVTTREYNSEGHGSCGNTVNKGIRFYDPFTKKADTDLIHMFASMDGIFTDTGLLDALLALAQKSTISFLVSWAGDLQDSTRRIFKDPEFDPDSFEDVLSSHDHGFPDDDFHADMDAFIIASKKSLSNNYALSSLIDDYYISPKTAAQRIRLFYEKVLDASTSYHEVTNENFKKLIFEMMALKSDGTCIDGRAIHSLSGKFKFLLLKNNEWELELVPTTTFRRKMSLLFYNYIIDAMNDTSTETNNPSFPDPGLVTGDRFD